MDLNTKMIWPDQETNLDDKKREGKIHIKSCKKCVVKDKCAGIESKYLEIYPKQNTFPIKEMTSRY
jgi:hypothetical protein